MGIRDWHVTFRPWAWFRALSCTLVACLVLFWPAHTLHSEPYVPTRAELQHRLGHQRVERVLVDRMQYLDQGRRHELARAILEESLRASFDPLFILAVIEVESGFEMEAISRTGALGLMQVLPSTWREQTRGERLERFNPVHNVRVGVGYLRRLSESFKRPDTLLLAYNQGPGGASDIITKRTEPSAEAAAYGPRVLGSYRRLLSQAGLDSRDLRRLWRAPHLTVLR